MNGKRREWHSNPVQNWAILWNPEDWDMKTPMWRIRTPWLKTSWWPHETKRLKFWINRRPWRRSPGLVVEKNGRIHDRL